MIGTMTKFLSNSSRENCICEMTQSNTLISAINYFSQNQTCQLFFSNNNSMIIEYQVNSTLIFINQSIISIQTNTPPSTICVTNNSATLYNNQFIYSPATQVYAAGMLNNTFGIYKAYGYQNVTTTAIWRANQIHNSSVECFLNIQTDRNLVVYTTNLAVMWAASVPNSGSGNPFCLEMLDSGNLIWIARNTTIIWQTNTVQTG
ncbi:unnamed protein product [Adineta steineri]|uniref:Bulb-type lectin domain-containing protein n=1 Tax=Adineta steineri TaxID=433720 RepID=A0A814W190_9BILA|nr:unnamed protein product [Adineta steineri]CAF1196261.1 unnamed protein product [Adineta steineri]